MAQRVHAPPPAPKRKGSKRRSDRHRDFTPVSNARPERCSLRRHEVWKRWGVALEPKRYSRDGALRGEPMSGCGRVRASSASRTRRVRLPDTELDITSRPWVSRNTKAVARPFDWLAVVRRRDEEAPRRAEQTELTMRAPGINNTTRSRTSRVGPATAAPVALRRRRGATSTPVCVCGRPRPTGVPFGGRALGEGEPAHIRPFRPPNATRRGRGAAGTGVARRGGYLDSNTGPAGRTTRRSR